MQILKMMITVFLIFAFLFLPIIIDVGIVFPSKAKKGYFCLRIYGIIAVISGYVELLKDGVCLHLTKRKALILPYKSLLNVKNTLKPIKDFQINRFNLSIDIGSNDEIYTPLYIGYLTGLVSDSLGKFLSKSKPYLKFNTNVNVYNYSVLNFYLHGKLTFNFLVVFLEILRFLLEKIINVFKLQKQ